MPANLIGLLGGTFDPIHYGHLHIAEQVKKLASLHQIEFIPCHIPNHREQPVASPQDRYNMLKLAVETIPNFSANDIELNQSNTSYTINTVKTLSSPNQTLCFILGIDGFLKFNSWESWPDILNYCHLIIVNRPGYHAQFNDELNNWYQQYQTQDPNQLQQTHQGLILTLDIPPSPISATTIRQQLADRQPCSTIPSKVYDYIKQNNLYQYD